MANINETKQFLECAAGNYSDICAKYYSDFLKNDHCELCISGFRLEKGNCVKCPDNCQTCYKNNQNEIKCTTCDGTYMPFKGECVLPSTKNCDKFSSTYQSYFRASIARALSAGKVLK